MLSETPKGNESKHEKRIQNEILHDLRAESKEGRKDTVLNFPLARWLSHSVITRMKKNQQRIKDNKANGVDELLKRIIQSHKWLGFVPPVEFKIQIPMLKPKWILYF